MTSRPTTRGPVDHSRVVAGRHTAPARARTTRAASVRLPAWTAAREPRVVVALVVALVLLGAGGAGAFYLLRDTGEDKAGPAPVTTTDPGPTPSPTPSTRPSVTASA